MPTTPPDLTAAQRSVLYAIRRRGEVTVDSLADALDMTPSGARQHLAALDEAGLVALGDAPRVAGQRGRSERVARLTDAAETVFPKAYGELTNELLGYLEPTDVAVAFTRRRDSRIAGAKLRMAPLRSFEKRVAELAAILDRDGYLADWRKVGRDHFEITEHNCAILSVAATHPHACQSEIEFIRAVLPEATIERTEHIIAGAHGCTYSIRRG